MPRTGHRIAPPRSSREPDLNEAETCPVAVRPRIELAGWGRPPHSYAEQCAFTDGRVVVVGNAARRRRGKRADFLLRYTRDLTLAVVEAKSDTKPAGTGLQQAKDYAEILGLKFAYATNGTDIIEYDYFTGKEQLLTAFQIGRAHG